MDRLCVLTVLTLALSGCASLMSDSRRIEADAYNRRAARAAQETEMIRGDMRVLTEYPAFPAVWARLDPLQMIAPDGPADMVWLFLEDMVKAEKATRVPRPVEQAYLLDRLDDLVARRVMLQRELLGLELPSR